MSMYAVVNPATGEKLEEYPEISDDQLDAAIARAWEAREALASLSVGRARREDQARRRAPPRATRDACRNRGEGDGQADGAGPRRGRLLRRHLRVLRRPRGGLPQGRADRAACGRGHGGDPPLGDGAAARNHALELPLLPGGPLRGTEPDRRQPDPAEAGAPVPGVGRGDPEDVRRRRPPGGRVPDDPRDQRADRREGDPRPARARCLGHRLRASGRRRRRGRRTEPEEGGPRDGRLRPVHRARDPEPRRGRRRRGARRASTTRASRATPRSGSSSSTSSTTTSSRSSRRR